MKTNYDLYYLALEDHYKELEKLFLFKKELLEEYNSNYELENDIPYMDYLLTKKILEMVN